MPFVRDIAPPVLSSDVHRRERFRTAIRRSSLRIVRAHAQNSINVRLDGPNGSRIVWVVNDPVDGDGWSSAQLDSIRRLLPHVRQTVRVQQALAGVGALSATLEELLDTTVWLLFRFRNNRHSFAVNTLLRWYRDGVDVEHHIPRLATWLGHAHVSDTYWYLTATPELMRIAARRLDRIARRSSSGAPVRMIMQVHDELVFEVAREAAGDVTPLIRERMSGVADLSVPLVVDVGEGDNWDEAQ